MLVPVFLKIVYYENTYGVHNDSGLNYNVSILRAEIVMDQISTTVILAEFCDKRKKKRVALRRVSFFFFVLVLESKTNPLK